MAMGFIVMSYQHLLHLKNVRCYLPPPLVYGLYASENDDNCEQPLSEHLLSAILSVILSKCLGDSFLHKMLLFL